MSLSPFKHWMVLQKIRGKLVGDPNLSFRASIYYFIFFLHEKRKNLSCLHSSHCSFAHSFGFLMIANKQLMGLSFCLTVKAL